MLLRSTTVSINSVLGSVFALFAVVRDAFAGLTRRFRPVPQPRNLGVASLLSASLPPSKRKLLSLRLVGLQSGRNSDLLCPRLTSADPSHRLLALLAPQFFASQMGRSPRVMRPLFRAFGRRIYLHALRISLRL